MKRYRDLTGMKFGKLTAIKPVNEKLGWGHHKRWICNCECGNTTIVSSDHLTKGDTKSCGCRNHGKSKTRIFGIWTHMKSRCHVPTDDQYYRYGGRGIKVCDEWYKDFMKFYNWSIANGYSDELSIDRIDNDKGYCPENCRWATTKIQANNTSRNKYVTYNGETHTIAEWSDVIGIKQNTLTYRLRRGWSIERALTEKVNK
jgi:hypothetical protein